MSEQLKTRYRDIPFEEIAAQHDCGESYEEREAIWNTRRGKEIIVEIPPVSLPETKFWTVPSDCKGPYYWVIGPFKPKQGRLIVCSHLAEIGD